MDYKPYVTAVIVAAGNSTRMSCGISKQLIPLLGKPAISYTFRAFEEANSISEIVVVCRESDRDSIREVAQTEGCSKVSAYVIGGATRSESVSSGIRAASTETTHFAIHDGARVLILPGDIDKVVSAALECGAAALGIPVTDTIKIVDDNGYVVSTPDRGALRAAQTPQVFEKQMYISALEKSAGMSFTDDCALIEHAGGRIQIVFGDYSNIKLTTPQDIAIAESILSKRQGG